MGNRTIHIAVLALLLTCFAVPALAKTVKANPVQGKASPVKPESDKPAATSKQTTPYGRVVLAKVADQAITREDLIHMIQIEKAYSSTVSEPTALMMLMKDVIFEEVARSVGVEIPPAEIPTHFPIIDQFTPANPAQLQETLPADKQPFHVGHADYARLYLLPRMLFPKLHIHYTSGSDLHPVEKGRIEQAFQSVRSGKSFGEAAREAGLTSTVQKLTAKDILLPSGLVQRLPQTRNMPKNPLLTTLDQLSPGEIVPKILEDEGGYRVIRLLDRIGAYNIEVIAIAKPPFDTWFSERTRNLSIAINDEKLKNAIKAAYSNVEWVSRLQ